MTETRRSWNFGRLALAAWIVAVAGPASAAVIGEAAKTQNQVSGSLAEVVRQLQPGDGVSANEQIRTGDASSALLRFLDQTQLNIGAASTVNLDRFVYNPDNTAEDAVINLTKGAMRFVTGRSEAKNFTIRSEVATLGIRGTDFILACIEAVKKCVVLIDKGKVGVCPHPIPVFDPAKCPDAYELTELMNFTYIGPDGANSGPQQVPRSVIDAANSSIANGRIIKLSGLPDVPAGPRGPNGLPPRFPPIILGTIPVGFGVLFAVLPAEEPSASP
jgi:hypothetical protein